MVEIFVQTAYTMGISKKGVESMAGSTTNISIRMDAELKPRPTPSSRNWG